MINSELLTKIGMDQAERFIADPNFVEEEKYNGERRTICKQHNQIINFNREGDPGKRLPSSLVAILLQHPLSQFVIDIEILKSEKIVILDALVLGDEQIINEEYRYRKARAMAEFKGFHKQIWVAPSISGAKEKREFLLARASDRSEGVVFKNIYAPYRQGRSGQHYALKFWKSLDAVVMAPSRKGHNSVEVGLYHQGKLQRICGVSLNGKKAPKMGDVIEMDYLYGTERLEVVQPDLVRIRYDKRPTQCTMDQVVINKNFSN